MKAKFLSRKLLVTVAGCITVIGNQYFGLHLNNDTVLGVVTMVSTYVLGQGYVDSKQVTK